jgi:hypothetical protein
MRIGVAGRVRALLRDPGIRLNVVSPPSFKVVDIGPNVETSFFRIYRVLVII